MCEWISDLWSNNDVPELIYISKEQAKYKTCGHCGQQYQDGYKKVKPSFNWSSNQNFIDTDFGVFKLKVIKRK